MQSPFATWRRRALPLLGTYVEIAVPAPDEAQLRRWSDPAFARVAAFHAAMSFHSRDSDLAAIARAGAGDVVRVGHDTWCVLRLALELEAASGGVFDVAVAPELVRRGVLPPPAPGGAPAPLATSAAAALRLDDDDRLRVLAPVWIDLGGIAKGAAVDAAIEALRAAGAPSALVNAGGDLRAYGAESHPLWVRHPGRPGEVLAVASLGDGAFATSAATSAGAWRQLVARGECAAAPAWPSVSVAAPTCVVADALTKLVALAGPRSVPVLCRYDARAVWIDAEGCLHDVR